MARPDRPDLPQGIADNDMVLTDHLGGQQTFVDYANNGGKFIIDAGSAELDKVKQDSPPPGNFNLIASVISAGGSSTSLGAGVGPDGIGRWKFSWLSVAPGLGQLIRVEEMAPGTEVTHYNLDVLSVIPTDPTDPNPTDPNPTDPPPPQPPGRSDVERPTRHNITQEPEIQFLSHKEGDTLPSSSLFAVVVRTSPAQNGKETIPAAVLISAFYGNDKGGTFVPNGQVVFGRPVARNVDCGIVEEVLCLQHPKSNLKPDRIYIRAATIRMFKNESSGDKKFTGRSAKLLLAM